MKSLLIILLVFTIFYYLIYISRHDLLYHILPQKYFLFLHYNKKLNKIIDLEDSYQNYQKIENNNNFIIPKVFVQTMKTLKTTKRHKLKIDTFKKFHSDFEHIIFDDLRMDSFVHSFGGKIEKAYKTLTQGAMKADLFRLLYLFKFGGYYFDSDCYLTGGIPLNEKDDLVIFRAETHIIQWCIFSKKEHPVIKLAIDKACYNILNDSPEKDKRYPEPLAAGFAGPVVLGKAIEKVMNFRISEDFDSPVPFDKKRKVKLLNYRKNNTVHHKYSGYMADMILIKQPKWKSNMK